MTLAKACKRGLNRLASLRMSPRENIELIDCGRFVDADPIEAASAAAGAT